MKHLLAFIMVISVFSSGLDKAFTAISSPESGYRIVKGSDYTVAPGSYIHIAATTTKAGAVYGSDTTLVLKMDGETHSFQPKRMEHGSVFFTWPLDSMPSFDSGELFLTDHKDSVISVLETGAFHAKIDSTLYVNKGIGLFPWQRTVDLGDILEADGMIPVVFTIENTTDREQPLRSIRATCGCTKLFVWDKTIEPMTRYHIYAFFNPRRYGGQTIDKKVTITLDLSRILQLSYTANVK